MTRRLCALLVCALVPIGVVTGCGSSGTSSTKSTTTTTKHTSTVPLSVRVDKAVVACRKEVAGDSAYIPAGETATGEADCEGVKTGNATQVAALRTMLRDACELEVTEKAPADEQRAEREACKKAY